MRTREPAAHIYTCNLREKPTAPTRHTTYTLLYTEHLGATVGRYTHRFTPPAAVNFFFHSFSVYVVASKYTPYAHTLRFSHLLYLQ